MNNNCHLVNLNISTLSRDHLSELMVTDCFAARKSLFSEGPKLVFDINGQGLSLMETNKKYKQSLACADLIHADGGFIVTLSKYFTSSPIFERSATTDLFHDCAAKAAERGLSFFILGGTEDVNFRCVEKLKSLYPNLIIAGRLNGYFKKCDEHNVINYINSLKPDILWVGLGKPKEQIFSCEWKKFIKSGWLVTCGGCFNFITGDYVRAPQWMQNSNIEWLHRMFTQPKTLFIRYLKTNPHALWIFIKWILYGKH